MTPHDWQGRIAVLDTPDDQGRWLPSQAAYDISSRLPLPVYLALEDRPPLVLGAVTLLQVVNEGRDLHARGVVWQTTDVRAAGWWSLFKADALCPSRLDTVVADGSWFMTALAVYPPVLGLRGEWTGVGIARA